MWFRTILLIILAGSLSEQGLAQKKECVRASSASFRKNICSAIENNKAYLVKYQLQKKSGQYNLLKILEWTRLNYECMVCKDEPGFTGGSLLRKCVFDDALSVAFLLVYEAEVDLNFIEKDGKTLLDWVQEDTEKNFDAAFDTDNDNDAMWLLKQVNINTRYFNLFRNNGAKLRGELTEK